MKKIFLVVSILFLTASLYARDYILLNYAKGTDLLKKLKDTFQYRYYQKDDSYFFTCDNLYLTNRRIDNILFEMKPGNDCYIMTFVLEDMDVNDYVDFIAQTMVDNNLIPDHQTNVGFCFTPLEQREDSLVIYFTEITKGSKSLILTKNF